MCAGPSQHGLLREWDTTGEHHWFKAWREEEKDAGQPCLERPGQPQPQESTLSVEASGDEWLLNSAGGSCLPLSDFWYISKHKIKLSSLRTLTREFLGRPVVRTLRFHCSGTGSVSGRGTKIPYAMWCGQTPPPQNQNQNKTKQIKTKKNLNECSCMCPRFFYDRDVLDISCPCPGWGRRGEVQHPTAPEGPRQSTLCWEVTGGRNCWPLFTQPTGNICMSNTFCTKRPMVAMPGYGSQAVHGTALWFIFLHSLWESSGGIQTFLLSMFGKQNVKILEIPCFRSF